MILLTIRKYIGIVMAMGVAIACGVAVVSYMRYETVSAQLDTALTNNESLTQINKDNANTIEELISQRKIDDELLEALQQNYKELEQGNLESLKKLEELKRNDEETRKILNIRHSSDVNRLFNTAQNADRIQNDQGQATK